MTQTFMKICGSRIIEKFIRKFYGGVVKKDSYNLISDYRLDRIIAAPCPSRFRSCSANVNSFKRRKSDAPISNCPNILRDVLVRHYCTKHDSDFPRLTRLKCRGYPTTLSSFSNFFLTYLVVKPHLDRTFSANEFLYTTKKVVEIVSCRIAEANFEALKDLVTNDVLEEIKTNVHKFSVNQRQDLAVTEEELVYSFLDTISLNVDNESNTKSLEILTIHHAFKGIKEVKKLVKNFNPMNAETMQKEIFNNKPRPFVLNYRFLRKFYSTGEADDWIINGLQHQSGKSMKLTEFF